LEMDRQRSRPPLHGCAIGPLLVVEERDSSAPKWKPFAEHSRIRELVSVLGLKDGQPGEAGRSDVLVTFHEGDSRNAFRLESIPPSPSCGCDRTIE
jgi:hypothetical protein